MGMAKGRVPLNSASTMVMQAVMGTARNAPGMPHSADQAARLKAGSSQAAQDLAAGLARGPRIALAHMKANLLLAEHASLAHSLDAEASRHVLSAVTDDHREAAAAFAHKRAAIFTGR